MCAQGTGTNHTSLAHVNGPTVPIIDQALSSDRQIAMIKCDLGRCNTSMVILVHGTPAGTGDAGGLNNTASALTKALLQQLIAQ
jgi:hypothetical protein